MSSGDFPYYLLVCGGRDYHDEENVFDCLDALNGVELGPGGIIKVINGGATGADQLSTRWARARLVPYKEYPADWNRYGRRAGPLRNIQMLTEEPLINRCLAFPGGVGTNDMTGRCRAKHITVQIAPARGPAPRRKR